jgi:hypothetical protein
MNRLTALVIAIAALLALPAAGHASQSFGSLLKNSPANGSDQCVENATGPCTVVSYINPNDAGDPVTSPAPADGVIVKLRLRTMAAESVTLRLATISKQGETALAQAAGAGPALTTQGTGEIEEFAVRVPVSQGQHLALDAPSTHMVYNQGGDEFAYVYAPPLAAGQGPRAASAEQGELLLQAVMEPDVDRDGLGDETQDPRIGQDAGGGADAAPVVESLRVSGGRIKYRLSEDATVRFRIEKRKNGRFAKVRTLSRQGSDGTNALRLPRSLADGRYRVVAVATDAAGQKSAAKRARFRVR